MPATAGEPLRATAVSIRVGAILPSVTKGMTMLRGILGLVVTVLIILLILKLLAYI